MKQLDVSGLSADKIKNTKPYKGGDPELFFGKGGKMVSSTDFLPEGERKKTRESCSEIFSDGYQAEVNFPPTTCRECIILSISEALHAATDIGAELILGPVAKLSRKWLAEEAHASVLVSGCKPDFCAYNHGEPNDPVNDFDKLPYRFAGGHIMADIRHGHMSVKCKTADDVIAFIKLCDRVVGIPSVIRANSDDERLRRKYYGKPGCFRWKPGHHIEYRCMSNWWLASPALAWIVYGWLESACKLHVSGLTKIINDAISDEDVHDIMVNADRDKAIAFVKYLMPAMRITGGAWTDGDGYKTASRAMAAILALDPKAMFSEWGLEYWVWCKKYYDTLYNEGRNAAREWADKNFAPRIANGMFSYDEIMGGLLTKLAKEHGETIRNIIE